MLRSLAIAVVLVAAACGGSKKEAAEPPTAPAEPAVAEPEGVEGGVEGGVAGDPDADELSKEDCEAVLDHVSQLLVDAGEKELAEDMASKREESLTECMATGTRAEYDCFMAAKVMQDLMNCGG